MAQPATPPAPMGDVEKLLFGGSTPSVKWGDAPGMEIRITVENKATQQRRDFAAKGQTGLGALSYWPDGSPRMQIVLTGPCEVRNSAKEDFKPCKDPTLETDGKIDDGRRTLYISSRSKESPGSTMDAILAAMRKAQAGVLEIGAVITMRHDSGIGTVAKPRVHSATYEAPKPVDAFDHENLAGDADE